MPWIGVKDGVEEPVPTALVSRWVPTMWSFKKAKDAKGKLRYVRGDDGQLIPTNPKFHDKGVLCANLESINTEFEHVQSVVRWVVYRHRRGLVRSILDNVRPDGRISATGMALGTPTSRVTHAVVANIPKAEPEVVLGKECRAMFCAPVGRALVGVDAAGLELRMLAHYVAKIAGDPNHPLIDIIVKGTKEEGTEIHTLLWKACEPLVPSRSVQKNVTYCVPMDTRALTRTGWKFRHELVIGEEVLTYNAQKNVKEWKPILALHDTEGVVYRLKHGHHWDVRATADHRWYVRQRTGKSTKYMLEEVRTTFQLTSESNIITNAPMVPDTVSAWAGFSGDKWGQDWVGHVLRMSSKERQAFLSGFVIADGYTNPDTGRFNWSQNRNELFEGALLATYLEHSGYLHVTGRQMSNGQELMRVTPSTKQHVTMQKVVRTEEGVEPVWCLTTENGSWVMRQGDVITITGNCWLYGGSDQKLGQTAGHPEATATRIGKEVRRRMIAAVPGLDALTEAVETAAKRGWIEAMDGRRIAVRMKHAALNTLLQSAGSILVKWAQCYMNQELRRLKLDAFQVISYHDEVQLEASPEHAEQAGRLFIEGLQVAGRRFGVLVPLDGEVKVGQNWADTH